MSERPESVTWGAYRCTRHGIRTSPEGSFGEEVIDVVPSLSPSQVEALRERGVALPLRASLKNSVRLEVVDASLPDVDGQMVLASLVRVLARQPHADAEALTDLVEAGTAHLQSMLTDPVAFMYDIPADVQAPAVSGA